MADVKPQRQGAGRWLGRMVTAPVAQVVQVGSHDGERGDPLRRWFAKRPGWKGLFAEPVPWVFARLRANYGEEERFQFANVVVNDGSSQLFYWVDEAARKEVPTLPPWVEQLASSRRNHILAHEPSLEPFVREARLPGMSLARLLDEHEIRAIDVFHVDAEGDDWSVLRQLDLERFHPQAIIFEHKHLSREDRRAAVDKLVPRYRVFRLGADMLAIERANANVDAPEAADLRSCEIRRSLLAPVEGGNPPRERLRKRHGD